MTPADAATIGAAVPRTADDYSPRAQTLRGIACLLLVAFHVVVDNSLHGLEVAGNGLYQDFMRVFQPLRMPLFSFLSGFVYAYRPVDHRGAWQFARKKVWRLLVPFVVVTTLLIAFQVVTGERAGMRGSMRLYLFPFAHLWFLQSLMLILLVVVLLEATGVTKRLGGWCAAIVLAFSLDQAIEFSPNYFSINHALRLLPFFLAGVGANRFRELLERRRIRWPLALVFAVSFVVHALASLRVLEPEASGQLLLATISFAGCLTLIRLVPPVPLLARIGGYAFAIYLFHVFFTFMVRAVLDQIGVPDDRLLYFCAALAAGVAGPIVVERLAQPNPVTRRLLLGQS